MALDAGQLQKLRLVLYTEGWKDVIRPKVLERGSRAMKALCLSAQERAGEFKGVSDDELRARIRECEWMVVSWENEIVADNLNRQIDELDQAETPAANP